MISLSVVTSSIHMKSNFVQLMNVASCDSWIFPTSVTIDPDGVALHYIIKITHSVIFEGKNVCILCLQKFFNANTKESC